MESTQNLIEELTDRLVVAVEEQDLLYVLFWLKEMKQVDRSEAIHGEHSSRGLTAISSLVQNPFTPLRKIILEVLLLSGLESKLREAVDLGMKEQNWPVLQILLDWNKGGKEEAKESARILKCEMEEAADWIDRNSLSPPNPQSLTGYVELSVADQDTDEPQAAVTDKSSAQDGSVHCLDETSHSAQLSSSSNAVADVPSIAHSSTPSEFRSQTHYISSNTPQDIELKVQASRHSPPAPSSPLSFDNSAAFALLNLRWIPLDSRTVDVERIFTSIGVPCQVLSVFANHHPTFSVVRVYPHQASRCIQLLDRKYISGRKIECNHYRDPNRTVNERHPSRSYSQPTRPAPSRSPPRSRNSRSRSPSFRSSDPALNYVSSRYTHAAFSSDLALFEKGFAGLRSQKEWERG